MKKITTVLCALFTIGSFALSATAQATELSSQEEVLHTLNRISKEGTLIAIEDESQWIIPETNSDIALSWQAGDQLSILPNNSFFAYFSPYTYIIANLSKGTQTLANLYYGPRIDGSHSKQVTELDFVDGDVTLNDGSSWRIATRSQDTFSNWQPSDYIIVGTSYINNNNILINVNLDSYVESTKY